ncbi:hypothetical protein AMELA_G00115710 [Ameiurus melas]|uniref:Lysine-specific demethylase 3B PWWP domain-containing protein n=1 Tax=Ameiurus melas TaxID=219545 RepID=A0A7J6ATK1_AMEME|nr:hypothetical protein AMELA_G00115710 [Ameiurus melas]
MKESGSKGEKEKGWLGSLTINTAVYVEFDDLEWDKREWVKVYEDFQIFLLEQQLVWAKRKEGSQLQGTRAKQIQWPALVSAPYPHSSPKYNRFLFFFMPVCVSLSRSSSPWSLHTVVQGAAAGPASSGITKARK